MTFKCLHYCSYKQIDTCCVSQGSVMTFIRKGYNFVTVLLQIHSGNCTPKIIKIERDLTKL